MSHDPSGTPGKSPAPESSTVARSSSGTFPMQHGHRPAASEEIPATLVPEQGWHCMHVFYQVDRARLGLISTEQRQQGLDDFRRALRAKPPGAPEQIQCFAVPGHKADFGVVMAGPDLRAIHDVQMAIQASSLGPGAACRPTPSTRSPRSPSTSPTPSSTAEILRDREGARPREQHLQDQGRRLHRTARPDEPAAALSRVPRLAVPLFLSDEQDAHRPTRTGTCCRSRNGPS